MGESRTVEVAHLGGIEASYRLSTPFNPKKPTLVLINSFLTASPLYNPQFLSRQLTDVLNLLAIEPLGHGKTKLLGSSCFTYWDSAMMNLQALDKLGIEKAYILGTSQGGWIAARMALLRPDKACHALSDPL
jgi:pimeloyl-ACP methyl ester carboxylesterase